MPSRIYEKTAKGRDEIATRRHQVSPRLRTLLVMIDGRQPLATLLQNFSQLGFDQACIDELVRQDYIRPLPTDDESMPGDTESAAVARPPPGLRRQQGLRPVPSPAAVAPAAPAAPDAPDVADVAATVTGAAPLGNAERFQAVHRFYNETIRANLGLRGLPMQLKVEKAASLDALSALRQPYLDAVRKAKGSATAQALDTRLLALLGEHALA